MGIFIDSGAFIAYYNKKDEFHDVAVEIFTYIDKGDFGEMLTSDYVLDEALTRTDVQIGRERAVELGNWIAKNCTILHVDEHIFQKAWDKFNKHRSFSFTDCTILVLLEAGNIEHLFTFDRAFTNFAKVVGAK